MKTILLTTGSGPFALCLARTFHRAGFRVIAADCWEHVYSRYSKAVDSFHHVPSPALETEAWINSILGITKENSVDLIVPVFEEALFLAEAFEGRHDVPNVFGCDFQTLLTFHNKWLFNQCAVTLGLAVPESRLLTSREELLDAFAENPNRVFKPVYSRWASFVVVCPKSIDELQKVEPSCSRPWIVQDFLPGRPFATYSLAHNGRLTAHVTYPSDMTTGYGPTFGYRPVRHPEIFEWVRKLVEARNYTGQIGVDFIEDANGQICATECNPRATGAMYLLKDDSRFADAFLNPDAEMVEPQSNRASVLRIGMSSCLFRHPSTFPGYRTWAKMFFAGKGINVFQFRDPMPAIAAPYMIGKFILRCIKEKKDAKVLMTLEREWGKEPELELQMAGAGRASAVLHPSSLLKGEN